MDESPTQKLMSTLITKMESMDSDLQMLKQENARLRAMVSNPASLMKKSGLVSISTPFTENVSGDAFRPLNDGALLIKEDSTIPQSNEEFHGMDWDDIHDLVNQHKSTEAIV